MLEPPNKFGGPETALLGLMDARRLLDVSSPDFALTARTRRLHGHQAKQGDASTTPFVTMLVVPEMPSGGGWAASDASIYRWLDEAARKSSIFPVANLLPKQIQAMHGGVLLYDSADDPEYPNRYVALERTGILEVGLGAPACRIGTQTNERYFHLVNIIAHLWELLHFAGKLNEQLAMEHPLTLLVNFRNTSDALLDGLAQGWVSPRSPEPSFKPRCREPHLQMRHDKLGPRLGADGAARIAREVAFEIDAAWGVGSAKHFPRCFKPAHGTSTEGEFDISAFKGC